MGNKDRLDKIRRMVESRSRYDNDLAVGDDDDEVTVDSSKEEQSSHQYDDTPQEAWPISGPIGSAGYPGRRFESAEQAVTWAVGRYKYVKRVTDAERGGRWILLVKK